MTGKTIATGIKGSEFRTILRQQIVECKPHAFAVAAAYVSTSGFNYLNKILKGSDVAKMRLVTDIKDGITHPSALSDARSAGWEVRVVNSLAGTFHPKMYLGGKKFDAKNNMTNPSMLVIGSANLTWGGLVRNGECSFIADGKKIDPSANTAWVNCWELGTPLNDKILASYEKYFATRNRYRRLDDIVTLGVSDDLPIVTDKKQKPPSPDMKPFSEGVAFVAWAGLESFTGEYNLQVEFPKESGLVLKRIIRGAKGSNSIEMLCSDKEKRAFKYRYYEDNGMFRLNIPNSVPLVEWVRTNKTGIACIEAEEDSSNLKFTIYKPSVQMNDVTNRSFALGSWGRTTTRFYGWF